MNAITLRSVTKHFGDVQAVRGIDLTVGRGEVLAFLGPNGAGKTTTIDMVLGLTTPTDGDVSVLDLHPRQAVERGLVSAVLQSGGLLKDMTVRESVEYTAALFPATRPVDEVLAAAGLTDLQDRRLGDCSGGEQQRTRFAMALVPDPELLVLDEPTTGMDVSARRAFWGAIRADAEQGRTVVFATHYLDEAETYADRVVVVREGRVVADGTPAELGALTSGRTVSATLEGADPAALEALPGVTAVEVAGTRVHVLTTDSDAVARHLLVHTAAHDLEVTGRGLEDALAELAGRLVELDPARARAEVEAVEGLAREALADVRGTVEGFREISLAGEIARARAALESAGIESDLPRAVDGVDPDLRELYAWTVREGVTNVIRHSGARTCTVTIDGRGLRLADDGRVPTTGPAGRSAGHGLTVLAERAREAGATLTARRLDPRGFEIRVSPVAGSEG